jgi:hypothetical protein
LVFGSSEIFNSADDEMSTVFGRKPIFDIVTVAGGLAFRVKVPSDLVEVLWLVPLMITDAPGTGVPFASVTLPLTWALIAVTLINKVTKSRNFFFITVCLIERIKKSYLQMAKRFVKMLHHYLIFLLSVLCKN